jgi:hypothetical protein
MKYCKVLRKAGLLLALDDPHLSSTLRGSLSGGMPIVTDGPFAETKEAVGYCRTIQVRSKQEAIEWANRCPGFDNEYDRDSSSTEAVRFSHRPGEAVVALLAQAKQRKAS